MHATGEQPHEEAFRHVLAHRTMLKAYVQAIVRDPVVAEDTFSEVTLEIVRVWDRFDSSRPFEPWARGLARRVALTKLRQRQREPETFDEAVLENLGEALDDAGCEAELSLRKDALLACLEKLPAPSRRLIELRYFENVAYEEIARTLHRTVGALYAAVSRIQVLLRDCVERTLRVP